MRPFLAAAVLAATIVTPTRLWAQPPSIGACDASCVVSRMTTLDDSWGTSPRRRAEARDAVLLDALVDAVKR